MQRTKHLLIGGGLASLQAGKMLRHKDPDSTITLVAAEPHLPYDRPPLSKELLRGEKASEQVFYEPQSFFDEKGVRVVLGRAVTALNTDTKSVRLEGGEAIAFDRAFIATGGKPLRLNVPGSELRGVHYLRTIDNARDIASDAAAGKKCVVIGAGFIGMEVAASLTHLGVDVTVVEAFPHVWPRFLDETLARYFQDYCAARGVRFLTGEKVTRFSGSPRVKSVVTASGVEIDCDLACIGVGIAPEVALAEQAGLETDNGIVVNEFLQTSHRDIYAGGDVVNYPDPIFKKRRRVEHWGHAEYCGQVAGLNMAGAQQSYDLLTYVWSDIFDLHIECAGDETERDRILVRGKMGDESFIVLYMKRDTLRAYFAINANKREFPKLQRLIRRAINLAGRDTELQDPSYELKSLL